MFAVCDAFVRVYHSAMTGAASRACTFFGRVAVTCLCFCASAVQADDTFEASFLDWADRHAMHPVELFALDARGVVIAQVGTGDSRQIPMPLASISKTIAGQCVLHAVRGDLLSFATTTGDMLGWSGPQGEVTVAQLLTHTTGFGPDATQTDIFGQNLTDADRVAAIVADIAERPLQGQDHFYNNENYLVLGAVMRAVVGEDAVGWCLRSVPALKKYQTFAPAQATYALGFAGGLQASAPDLAHFFHDLRVTEDWPTAPMGGPNAYGPGIIMQQTGAGTNLFHVGGLCLVTGVGFGAFAARLANGESVAVLYSGCADGTALAELNALILSHVADG